MSECRRSRRLVISCPDKPANFYATDSSDADLTDTPSMVVLGLIRFHLGGASFGAPNFDADPFACRRPCSPQ